MKFIRSYDISSDKLILLGLTLLAFAIRIWKLDAVPPGWRDDELINSLVISQKVLDGNWAFYYADASGHEALYHVLNAGMLALFGPGITGIRLLSVFLGTLTVPMVYLVGRQLVSRLVGLIGAGALAMSFWSLMYSRIGIRHISLVVFLLPTIYFFSRGIAIGQKAGLNQNGSGSKSLSDFIVSAIFMTVGFYTYFAARGIPIILALTTFYIFVFFRERVFKNWKGIAVMFLIAIGLAIPLSVSISTQAGADARIEELAGPLTEARTGNFKTLGQHIVRTINMFHSDGDEEWLYNIPNRPVFAPVISLFFWAGVLLSFIFTLHPILRTYLPEHIKPLTRFLNITGGLETAGALLFIWWFAGITPSFLSVPPGSLGHTIIALPPTFLLLALPLYGLERVTTCERIAQDQKQHLRFIPWAVGFLILVAIATRDLPDYFGEWPDRGMTRFLYRADLADVADYLDNHPDLIDFGITSLLAGPWDREALKIHMDEGISRSPRWFNSDRVVFLEAGNIALDSFVGYPRSTELEKEYFQLIPNEVAGDYQLARVQIVPDVPEIRTCFVNHLCAESAEFDSQESSLTLIFKVVAPLDLPPFKLISNPPPPGVYSGPRLLVFSQVLDDNGTILSQDDGLWVDIHSLKPGDRFLQQHRFQMPDNSQPASVVYGLYDPKTGERILTTDGRDHIVVTSH